MMMMVFDIGVTHRTVPHLLADLVELLIILRNEPYSSKSDVSDLLIRTPVAADDDADVTSESSAELNQAHEVFIEDLWSQFSYRQTAFDDFYPFYTEGNLLCRHSEPPNLNKNKIYIALLACSRLRSFDRNLRSSWSKLFAEISKEAMKKLLPTVGTVEIFDANSADRRAVYGTDLRQALRVLANKLSAYGINERIIDDQSSSGDGGYDLVGYLNFDDAASGAYYMLGQCGAQEKNWPSKTLESHPIKLRAFMSLPYDSAALMFTPVCYRKASGGWVNDAKTSGILLLDRKRILSLFDDDLVDEVIQTQGFIDFTTRFDAINVI
ncbi:hypothetical protein [Aeromonas veronii]|uniref:hypothetical protein n=1 Tax=Aeromonas veronii TaxID=654 RepID=UPI0013157F5F|nr:hypothetical protein [Aeromonas veronii]